MAAHPFRTDAFMHRVQAKGRSFGIRVSDLSAKSTAMKSDKIFLDFVTGMGKGPVDRRKVEECRNATSAGDEVASCVVHFRSCGDCRHVEVDTPGDRGQNQSKDVTLYNYWCGPRLNSNMHKPV